MDWSIILVNLEDNKIILENPSYGTLMEIISTDGTTNNTVNEHNLTSYITAYGMREYNSQLAKAMDDIYRKDFYNIRSQKVTEERMKKNISENT